MSYENTFEILGRRARLSINGRGNHCHIQLGDITITDASGDIGFWEGFNATPGSFCTGAARDSALDKYARAYVESEIAQYIDFCQQQLAEAE